ncbi:MAG: triose-phosphate isomerase [Bacillota bacterium]|nr:triose-phosphate isomerase [Bacillota bacterium]
MKIIAGNWKMNGVPSVNKQRLHSIRSLYTPGEDKVIVFPPYTSLGDAKDVLDGSGIAWGAQNVYCRDEGAYTGEISVSMLLDLGVTYCLVGHSERRQYFKEDGAFLKEKIRVLMAAGIIPIYCIGETLEQYEDGLVTGVLERQLREALVGHPEINRNTFIIAYEPVWAIGTGKTATPEEADRTMGMIREILAQLEYPIDINLLYGGSAKPGNAKVLLSQDNIDGLLIGGASLESESFNAMINWRES